MAALVVAFIVGVSAIAWMTLTSATIDAQSVIRDACEDATRVNSGVVTITGTENIQGTIHDVVIEVRIGGGNRSTHVEYPDLKAKGETYLVGNISYARETTSPGVWGEWIVTTVNMPDITATGPVGPTGRVNDQANLAPSFCGVQGLTDYQYHGVQTVGGEDTKRYSASMDEETLGIGDSVGFQFWITDAGQIKQFQVDERYVDGMGRLEREHYSLGVMSKLGEPITITAPTDIKPVVDLTPVPTPEGLFE